MRSVRMLFAAVTIMAVSGCGDYNWKPPGVYRIPIQQGTVIEQSMVSKLRPGMGKDQVKFIMGTPVIVDPFHSKRWEYIYTFKKGSDRVREQRHITLYFDDNDQLTHITGDIQTAAPGLLAQPEADERKQPQSIVVPSDRPRKGLFSRLIGGGDADKGEASGEKSRAEENIEVIEGAEDEGPIN